jgi:KGK domain
MLEHRFQPLRDEDVVSVIHDAHLISNLKHCQSQELYQALRSLMKLTDSTQANYHWLGDGVDGRLLKSRQSTAGWISGRAKLCLAFQPEALGATANLANSDIPRHDDVLEITNELARLTSRQNSLIAEIDLLIRQRLSMTDPAQSRYYWLDRGIECEVMKPSGELAGWQSGLIRLQFEFIPAANNPMGENSTVSQVGLDSLRQLAVN